MLAPPLLLLLLVLIFSATLPLLSETFFIPFSNFSPAANQFILYNQLTPLMISLFQISATVSLMLDLSVYLITFGVYSNGLFLSSITLLYFCNDDDTTCWLARSSKAVKYVKEEANKTPACLLVYMIL